MAMREIEGIRRSKEDVTIELRQENLVDAVLQIFYERFPQFTEGYIDDKGVWQIYEYTHPHNGDDVYKKGEKATEEELLLKAHLSFMQGLRF